MLPSLLFSFFVASLVVEPVSAGSKHWQPSIHHARGNATRLGKRAIGIQPGTGAGDTILWPGKTITYAFADSTASTKLKALFEGGIEIWKELKDTHGFKYNEVTTAKCQSDRLNCLMVNYNDRGYLASTLAIPAKDDKVSSYVGPTMYLSDSFSVGNREPRVNIAHEIGHAWGLAHEHQNEKRWFTSPEHNYGQSTWSSYTGDKFPTNQFNCMNLKDYAAKAQEVRNDPANANNAEITLELLCTSYKTAQRYKFSAMEWLPFGLQGLDADAAFDPDSLMLYPSQAGGIGNADENSDGRALVLTYAEGRPIPHRTGPSPQDINKLVAMYGSSAKPSSETYNKKGSKFRNAFDKLRKKSTRAGDTSGGLC